MYVNDFVRSELTRTKNEALWSRNIDKVISFKTVNSLIEARIELLAYCFSDYMDMIKNKKEL